jgi:pyridoxal 5'-phosphate synthase pdxS subunit
MYMDETFRLKVGLAEMLERRRDHGCHQRRTGRYCREGRRTAVMALERVPADIRKEGGVARMAPISKIREIMHQVSIPVMAKARIGHFTEARILEALAVDYIDESEVLTPADEEHHIDKRGFKVPFVCGARNLGEALRRIAEGAAMIRTKGEAGSGNIVEAVRHIRTIVKEMKQLTVLGHEELVAESKKHQAPLELME